MGEVTEKEKDLLKSKLKELFELENQENLLKQKKKELETVLNDFRPELSDTLQTVGRSRVRYKSTLVSKVPRHSHRTPSLDLTYTAIGNVLGQDAMNFVKQVVKEKRKRTRNSCISDGNGSVKQIPLKEHRKPRKDKKHKSLDKPSPSREEKKLKYMKRKKEQ